MKSVLEILNKGGVHLPTCEEWMEIAEIRCIDLKSDLDNAFKEPLIAIQFKKLMQRFEELVRKVLLTRQMFVCGAMKPSSVSDFYEEQEDEYIQAQSKLIFAGFEISETFSLRCGVLRIHVINWESSTWNFQFPYRPEVTIKYPTVFDLLIELDRYNRTAKEKIEIKWTENFVKELIS